jgi:DNA-binding protein YbaB
MLGGIGKGLSNAGQMMKAKQQADKMQKLMQSISVQGTSKNGKVNVTLNGEQKIVDMNIDSSLINFVYETTTSKGREDNTISKFIIEACNDAQNKVQGAVMKKIQESGDLGDIMSMLQGM